MTQPPTPALAIAGLKFRYPDADRASAPDQWTVDVPGLALAPGEHVLLRGGSGSGKSTLLQLVAGLLEPREGRVAVAGQGVHELKGSARDRFRGRSVGMIFQTFNLLHGFTAMENVMAALMFSNVPPREHAPRARELLTSLGIDRPSAPVDRLSVGQQQRVAVARAVACRPALVLADEPTASLDPENAGAALDLIQRACRDVGAALLCVSHDPALAPRFDRVRFMERGYLRPEAAPAQAPEPAPSHGRDPVRLA